MLLVVFVNSISFRSRDYSISGRNSSRTDPLSHLPTGLNLTIPSFANSNAILNADAATQVVSKYLHYHLEKYEAFYLESRRKLIVVIENTMGEKGYTIYIHGVINKYCSNLLLKLLVWLVLPSIRCLSVIKSVLKVICPNPAENPCYSGLEVLYVVESSGLRGPF